MSFSLSQLDGATLPSDLERPLYGATFGQAVTRLFKRYAHFHGRSSRSEFWWAQLFIWPVRVASGAALLWGFLLPSHFVAMNGVSSEPVSVSTLAWIVLGVIAVLNLALNIPDIALYWRRLHDGV